MKLLVTPALTILLCGKSAAYDALVDPDTDAGENRYRTIGAALAAAPDSAAQPYVIQLGPGRYREKLTIHKPNVTLLGTDRDTTLITYDAYAGQTIPGTDETLGTFRTATVTVLAPGFRAQNLTIENSFDFLANDALADGDPQKTRGTQAVALMLDGDSDRAAFRNVKLSGYQDTLYTNAGRSYFLDSLIEGNVDFIFGAGTALFENSRIRTRPRGREMHTGGYVTAPSTDISNRYGLVFLRCRLEREEGVPDGSSYLGRPWHPTTTFADGRYANPEAIGASVFIESEMDAHIANKGWTSMGGTAKDGGRIQFQPEDARFFEYENYGPGARINPQRRQLSEAETAGYTREKILGGWQVPFADL